MKISKLTFEKKKFTQNFLHLFSKDILFLFKNFLLLIQLVW